MLQEDDAYATRQLAATIAQARAPPPLGATLARVSLPTIYISATMVCSLLFVGCGSAGGVAAALDNLCWPAATDICASSVPLAIPYGLAGAAAVRASEAWRAGGSSSSGSCSGRDLLSHATLCGTLPIAVGAKLFANDDTVGERAVGALKESASSTTRALLGLAGAFSACTWTHGVVQQALTARLLWLDSAGVVIAGLGAAGLATIGDGLVAAWLLPNAASEAATREALSVALERCPQRFALEAPEEVASRRVEAFRRAVAAWEAQQAESAWRDDAAAAFRCVVCAAAYAASGGSIVAPLLASLGAVVL